MSTSNKVEFVWKDQEVNMALPKINFFGYVRNFDWEEKITSDSAVCGINIAAKDGYVVLDFKSYPYKKFAQVGIELNSWRLIEEAVNKSWSTRKKLQSLNMSLTGGTTFPMSHLQRTVIT